MEKKVSNQRGRSFCPAALVNAITASPDAIIGKPT
jgi:hypothetical protein